MTYITDPLPALSSGWLSSVAESFSYKMSTPDRNTDVDEQASTSKKEDKVVDKRGKTNSVVWKCFGFLSEEQQVCITTDSGTNIIKAAELNGWTRLQCFGHRLNSAIALTQVLSECLSCQAVIIQQRSRENNSPHDIHSLELVLMSDSSFITPDLSDCGSPAVLVSVCLITATAHNRLRAQRRRCSTASSVTPKTFKDPSPNTSSKQRQRNCWILWPDHCILRKRELISNSSDALEKLRHKMITAGGDTAPMEIHLQTDAATGTFTIQDT
ncbi:uncharacterized protein LOC127161128 [Labeo rohita]|uniref:uncharacterized protein LOC127161128 n=1 Tax=Labeo rohita TaxID=84645 RepID=UPI0021E294CF|nr:uncharacterized protein LOC127161128 [Labeo rohita]